MKKHFSVLICMFSFFILTSFSKSEQLDLMKIRDWKIIVTKNATPSEKFAAQEFQRLFELATHAKLEILNSSVSKSKNIFIGESFTFSNVKLLNELGLEGVRIIIKTDNINILGGKARGTLYAVYEFAERYLGIRFLTFDDTYVPPMAASLNVACEEYKYIPCFVYRSTYYKENIDHPDFSVRLRNNAFAKDEKFGGTSDMQFIVHSFYRQLPVETYGKQHPEYFAEVGGKRLLEAYGGGPQICVSNPDVINIMTKAVLKEIKEHPEYKNVSIVQNDNQYYCMCSKCQAINLKEDSPMGAHLALVNAVADSVAKVYPDVKVGTLAYQYNRKPPKSIIPRDNVMVQLCSIECDLLHAYSDPNNEMNKPFADDLAAWGKICKNLWIWDYVVDYYIYGLPFPNLKSIGKNIKYYKDNNVKGVFMEANYSCVSGEMSDLRNYVTSRCLWNPELDSWELTKEFCKLHYKNAATPIIEYLTLLHDNVEKKKLKARFNAKPFEVGIDAQFADYIYNKFQEALYLADDDIVRSRVEKASLCAYVAVIETARGEAVCNKGKLNYQSSAKYKEILKNFIPLAKKYDMKYYFEDESALLPEVEKNFNNELTVYARGGRPAITLEDSVWRIVTLPDEDAKIVQMLHKPSGFSFLPAFANNLNNGLFREFFIKGKNDKDTLKFMTSLSGNSLSLLTSLKDSTTYERKIILQENNATGILCKSTITNKSNKDRSYQLCVEPVFETGKRTRDSKIINAYIYSNNKFKQFNNGLIGSHGPDEHLLNDAKDGGKLLLFNNEKNIGIVESYDPETIDALSASWTDSGSLFKMGFNTKVFALKPGESYSFSYNFLFINKMPFNKN